MDLLKFQSLIEVNQLNLNERGLLKVVLNGQITLFIHHFIHKDYSKTNGNVFSSFWNI